MSRQPKSIDPDFDVTRLDPRFRELLDRKAKNQTIACAQVFDLIQQTAVTPTEAGKALDALQIRLTHCQLGLFGYQPEKKIAHPLTDLDPKLVEAVQTAAVDHVISCRQCWELAARVGVPKMKISGICETLGIRIKPCQLGAF